ncbi:MAG: ADP-ribosylation factor-like protein [Candidatus Bathyarchaeota archaeon]|nr:ADP-ribosylation factor-like protein [Candidatus Bathyarchaeota archaeon]
MFDPSLSSGKIPTGVPIVDNLLDGGMSKGSSVLLRAHPLADPFTLAVQFLHNRLNDGGVGLYFVNNKSPASVVEESVAASLPLDGFKRDGKLFFVDAYSALFGLKSSESYGVANAYDPSSVSKVVSQALSECSSKGKVFMVYDSLNTSLDESGETILNEIQTWKKIAIAYDAILCFIHTEWNYPPQISDAIKNLFPNIVDLITLERIIATQVVTVTKNQGNPVATKMIPITKTITGGVKGYIPKILVTGPFHAGKTTIVHTLSTRAVSVQRMGTTVALDFGHVDHRGFTLDLFGTVGQPRFDPVLERMGGEALGAVLVVDSTKPEEFTRAKEMMKKAGVYGLPYVIAANKQDLPDALSTDEIRKKMNVSPETAIVGTVGSDKETVLKALDILLDKILLQWS